MEIEAAMKIAYLSTLYPPYNFGGAEKALQTLAEAVASRAAEVVVICLHPEPAEVVEQMQGVRIYRLPIDNVYWPYAQKGRPGAGLRILWHTREMWNRKAAERVEAILERERPDVLHTHNVASFSVAVWGAAKRLKIPLVHTIHDYYLLCSRVSLFRNGEQCGHRCRVCQLFTWNRKAASRMVDAVVGVSEFTLGFHMREQYFEGSKCGVLYNIQPKPLPVAPGRSECAGEPLRFGFIGRVEQEKGIELLLEATRDLPPGGWTLQVAGKGVPNYVHSLQQRSAGQPIQWLGFVAAEEFYRSIDVLVIPSLWPEPLPYTCIEALLAGRGIIASATGGLQEIASRARLHRLFPPGDRGALAAAMKTALQDSTAWRTTYSVPNEVSALFSEERVVERYCEIYRSVMNASGSVEQPAASASSLC
jgi:glycosyltransferase involved in cell wall biosynthesis